MKLTTEQRNQLIERISRSEVWWTLQNRIAILKAAGLIHIIPHIVLETSPQNAAFNLITWMEGTHNEQHMQQLLSTLETWESNQGGQANG